MSNKYLLSTRIDSNYKTNIYLENLYNNTKSLIVTLPHKIKYVFWGWDDNTIIYCTEKSNNIESNIFIYNISNNKNGNMIL